MRIFNYILVLLAGFISFTACVKEDRDNCPPDNGSQNVDGRILHFKTWPEKYVFESQVENVQFFLYDKEDRNNDGVLIEWREVDQPWLEKNNYQVDLEKLFDLSVENYPLIAVMNMCDEYDITGHESLLNFVTSFVATNSDSISHKIADVFFGDIDLAANTKTVVRDTIDLYKLTNHIYLTVRFEGYTLPANHNVEAYIVGANSRYDYKREPVGITSLTYTPHTKIVDSSVFTFNITTGRLWIGDKIKLGIEEFGSNGLIYRDVSMFLTEEIAKLKDNNGNYLYDTNEKLMEEDEFYLEIVLNADFSIVEMKINNWFAVRPNVDL